MKKLILIGTIFIAFNVKAQINENTQPVTNTLESYQSPPINEIYKLKKEANDAAMNRARKETSNFLEYYSSIKSFKPINPGGYYAKIIFNSEIIIDGKVFINNNRIFEVDVAGNYFLETNGLKVNDDVIKGHSKLFIDSKGNYIPIEI
jgi:hypothetical protein